MRRSTLFVASLLASLGLACSEKIAAPTAAVTNANVTGVNAGTFVKLDGSPSSDPQGHPLAYNWSFVSRPLGSNATLIDAQTATPSFFADVPGDYVLQLVVSNNVLTSSQQVKVTVSTCGAAAPVVNSISVGNNSELPAIGATLQFIADVSDADNAPGCALNQTLSYQWTLIQQPAGSQAQLNSATSQTPSLVTDVAGDYGVRLVVTDSTNRSSAAKDTKVSIPNCGAATPTTVASPLSPSQPGALVQLDTTTSDADNGGTCHLNQTFTYAWTVSGRPQGSVALLSDPSAKSPTFTPDVIGDYQFTVVATDNTGRSSAPSMVAVSARCTPVAIVNSAVTFSITDPQATGLAAPHVGSAVTLTPNATVANYCGPVATNPLRYEWTLTGAPTGSRVQLDDANGASPTFVPDAVGTYSVSVVAIDQLGERSAAQSFSITTTNCGDNALTAAISGTAGAINSFQLSGVLTASASTADNVGTQCPARFATPVQFAWSIANAPAGGAATLTNLTGDSTQFEAISAGTYTVRLDASALTQSGRVNTAFALAQFQVNACAPPSLTLGTPAISGEAGTFPPRVLVGSTWRVYRDDVVALSASATSTCAGSTGVTYLWTLTAPVGSVARLTSVSSATTSFSIDKPNGAYSATVVAIDSLGNASAPQAVSFQAAACGANPIAADFMDTPGAMPFDDHTLTAVPASGNAFFTADDDPAVCPSHFAGRYVFNWSVASSAPSTGYVFHDQTGATVKFTPGGNAVYDIRLDVVGIVQHVDPAKSISFSCADTTPRTGLLSIASDSPGFTPGWFFLGDTATLSAAPSSLCFSPGNEGFAYAWTLQSPIGSSSVLSSRTAAKPTFAVDQAAAAWTPTLVVVDKLGNRSLPASASFTSQSCGINTVTTVMQDQTPGALPFDPRTILVAATSDDDNPSLCPARFKNATYVFSANVTSIPASGPRSTFDPQFNSPAPNQATLTFAPGDNAAYSVHATATGATSHVIGANQINYTISCAAPSPVAQGAPTLKSVAPPTGQRNDQPVFHRDDTIAFNTPAFTSACFSPANVHLSYLWGLTAGGTGTTPTLGNASSPYPTMLSPFFTADQPARTYHLSVTATDQWLRSGSASSDFSSDACGANPVSVTFNDTRPAGSLAFDEHDLTASATSLDDTFCPTRFNNGTYAFAWSVINAPSGNSLLDPANALSAAPGANTGIARFLAGDLGIWGVGVSATGSVSHNSSDQAQIPISALACDPFPAVGSITATGASTPHLGSSGTPDFNRSDVLTLAGTVTTACYTDQSTAELAYGWALTPAAGDVAPFPQLSSTTAKNPTFTADAASREYIASLVATDRWGHHSATPPDLHTFSSSSCGANPLSVVITASQAAGDKPLDPWSVSTTSVDTVDADLTKCPGRFAPTAYDFVWSAVPGSDGSTFSPTSTTAPYTTTFTPKSVNTSYAVSVNVSVTAPATATSPAGASNTVTVNTTCAAPTVGAVTLTDNGGPLVADPLVGDTIGATAGAASSSCFAHPTLTYTWHVNPSEALTQGATPDIQSFVPQQYNTIYAVSVTVGDGSTQTGDSGATTFTTSGCGSAAPIVSLVSASQHFDNVNQQQPGQAVPSLQPLDLLATPTQPEAQATVGTDHFPVPFYLTTPVSETVKVDSAAGGACSSFTLVGTQLLGPDGKPIASGDFTPPTATSVASGGTLDFSFTPRVGDVTTPGPVAGNYTLVATFKAGNAAPGDVSAPAVHVAGRCGLNAPFADALLSPATPSPVGAKVTADASTLTTDADNVRLLLGLGTSPAPNFSEGCGLDQTLTFAWKLTPPTGSSISLTSSNTPTTSFTPDVAGDYLLELTVADGTGATLPTSTATFTQTAQ